MRSSRTGRSNQGLAVARLGIAVILAWAFLVVLLRAGVSRAATISPAPADQRSRAPASSSVITIGVATALSGPVPELGWQEANAVQLAIDQINTAGGIEIGGTTYTVTMILADSACDGTEAITAANTLLDAGAVAIVGHTCSNASLSAQPLYEAGGVPMVSPSSSAPALTEGGYTTTFRVTSRDDAEAILLATYLHDELGVTRAAIVEWVGFEWGSGAFSTTFTGLGGAVTSRRTVSATDDYTLTLAAIQTESPGAIYYVNNDANAAGLLSRLAQERGMGNVVFGWDAWDGLGDDAFEVYVAVAGVAAEGDYAALLNRRTEDMPGYTRLNSDYRAAGFSNYESEIGPLGALAYDAAGIVIAAMDRTVSTNTVAIRDEIAAMSDYYGVVGAYQGFDSRGDVIPQWAWLERYQDGHWTKVNPRSPVTLYVDGSNGSDTDNDCRIPTAPCETIAQAVGWADPGDTVLVAQGTYIENLSIADPITLTGGYIAGGTFWLPGGETVIDGSSSQTVVGDWDGVAVQKPAVISDGAEYKMWFDGINLLGEVRVGQATSGDGISWTKYPAPVLTSTISRLSGQPGERAPFVLKEGGVYKMWYEETDSGVRQLRYATSTKRGGHLQAVVPRSRRPGSRHCLRDFS